MDALGTAPGHGLNFERLGAEEEDSGTVRSDQSCRQQQGLTGKKTVTQVVMSLVKGHPALGNLRILAYPLKPGD